MPAMALREYFEADGQRQALDEYRKFAGAKDWAIGSKMDMYEASLHAFNPALPEPEAFKTFNEKIYKQLSSWRWYRPASVNACWSSQQIFHTIKKEFSQFAWGGPIALSNLMSSAELDTLLSSLQKMREIKRNAGYPVMAVSKFLHFYNPALFPIYDTEVIWLKVLKCFGNEFKQFCAGDFTTKDSDKFLRNYVCWGGSLLVSAHPHFMKTFVDWLGKQAGSDLFKRTFDASTLYATAFEFTVIGAAKLNCPHLFDEKSKRGCV